MLFFLSPFLYFLFSDFLKSSKKGYSTYCLHLGSELFGECVFCVYHIAIYQHTHTHNIAQLVERSPRLQAECRRFESHLRQLLFSLVKKLSKRKVMRWPSVIPATSGITATAWTFPARCLENPRSTGSARGVCEYTHLAGTTGSSAQCVTLTPTVCWKFLRATTSITDKRLICRFGIIREEVAIIKFCVHNFLLTEGKVYKLMFIPVLFCLVLMFC